MLEIAWVGFYGIIGVTCWVIRIRVYIGYFLIILHGKFGITGKVNYGW